MGKINRELFLKHFSPLTKNKHTTGDDYSKQLFFQQKFGEGENLLFIFFYLEEIIKEFRIRSMPGTIDALIILVSPLY